MNLKKALYSPDLDPQAGPSPLFLPQAIRKHHSAVVTCILSCERREEPFERTVSERPTARRAHAGCIPDERRLRFATGITCDRVSQPARRCTRGFRTKIDDQGKIAAARTLALGVPQRARGGTH